MTYLIQPIEQHTFKPKSVELIFQAAWPTVDAAGIPVTFTCPIDDKGEHLIARLYISEGDGNVDGPIGYNWVRIRIIHPRYEILMVEYWVCTTNGSINIDSELTDEKCSPDSLTVKTWKLVGFLDDVVMPAIDRHLVAGRSSSPLGATT